MAIGRPPRRVGAAIDAGMMVGNERRVGLLGRFNVRAIDDSEVYGLLRLPLD